MSVMSEFLADALGTDNDILQRQDITLRAALAAAGTATDTYRVPSDYKLIIMGIRGHLAMLNMTAETAIAGAMADVTVNGHMLAKAMNCRLRLYDQDTNRKLFEDNGNGQGISLASLMDHVASRSPEFRYVPHTVPAGHTLRMDATLVDNAASVIGANTEYGVVLQAVLHRIVK